MLEELGVLFTWSGDCPGGSDCAALEWMVNGGSIRSAAALRACPLLQLVHDLRHPADLALAREALASRGTARQSLARRLRCIPAFLRKIAGADSLRGDDLEDLTQQVVAALWSRLDSYDGRAKLETWAYGFCLLEVRKWKESHSRSRLLSSSEVLEGEAQPMTEDPELVEVEHVRAAVASLGEPTSTVVNLKHFEELTFDEIGDQLDLSPNTAKTYYYRGLEKLRDKLRAIWKKEQA